MICFKEGRYYIQRPEASSSILILIISRFGVFIRNLCDGLVVKGHLV